MHGNPSPFNKIVCERRSTPKGAQRRRLWGCETGGYLVVSQRHYSIFYLAKKSEGKIIRFKSTDYWMESRDLRCKSNTSCCQYGPEQPAKCSAAPDSVMGLRSVSALRRRRKLHPHVRTQLPPAFSLTAYSLFSFCVTSCTVNELCLVAFQ